MMPTNQASYGLKVVVPLPQDRALALVHDALAREGFGVLFEIDMQAVLERKVGVRIAPYVILGACNPPVAHRALLAEPDIGLLLPCNVVVYQSLEGLGTVVGAIDPVEQLALTGNKDLVPVAEDVRAKLDRVLLDVAAGGTPGH